MPDSLPVPTDRRALLAGLGGLAAGTFLTAGRAEAGPLTPPGPPVPTPGPEPRVAINVENTPGDANSVFRIEQPGSYYLTGNVAGESDKHGIAVAVNNVTIDLMGFALLGVANSLDGVRAEGERHNIAVRNGQVIGWGQGGIYLATVNNPTGFLVEDIVASGNGTVGISVGRNAVVRNCVARNNSNGGIFAGFGSVVTDCSARQNGQAGIGIGSDSTVANCSAILNGVGISAGFGAVIVNCSTSQNTNHGISVNSTSLILSNVCSANALSGIRVDGNDVRVEGNNCIGNGLGIWTTIGGNFIVRNTCSGNTTANWQIAAGNVCLVVNAATAGVINGDSGGTSPGSTDPNANYTY